MIYKWMITKMLTRETGITFYYNERKRSQTQRYHAADLRIRHFGLPTTWVSADERKRNSEG
jgi:hypothetical protein